MFVFATGQLDRPRYIINFPTKDHWRSRSRLGDIDAGLADLRAVIVELAVESVALPPLGCGSVACAGQMFARGSRRRCRTSRCARSCSSPTARPHQRR